MFDQRLPIAFDTGVVESNIETAEFFHGFLDKQLNIGGFRDVAFHENPVAACGADHSDGFIAFGFAPAGDYDLGAFLRE